MGTDETEIHPFLIQETIMNKNTLVSEFSGGGAVGISCPRTILNSY